MAVWLESKWQRGWGVEWRQRTWEGIDAVAITIRRYMESRSCDVSKYVGLLVQIEKHLQVVHADESHQRTIDSYFTRDLST